MKKIIFLILIIFINVLFLSCANDITYKFGTEENEIILKRNNLSRKLAITNSSGDDLSDEYLNHTILHSYKALKKNSSLEKAYLKIVNAFLYIDNTTDELTEVKVEFDEQLSSSYEAESMLAAVNIDWPMFMFGNGEYYSTSKYVIIYINDEFSQSEKRINAKQAVKDSYNEFKDSLKDKSKIAQIVSIYEMCKNVTYDASSYTTHTLYGVLINKFACCDGFAKIIQYTLNDLGIDTLYVIGKKLYDHSWNMIKYDSKWYYMDILLENDSILFGSNTLENEKYKLFTSDFSKGISYLEELPQASLLDLDRGK